MKLNFERSSYARLADLARQWCPQESTPGLAFYGAAFALGYLVVHLVGTISRATVAQRIVPADMMPGLAVTWEMPTRIYLHPTPPQSAVLDPAALQLYLDGCGGATRTVILRAAEGASPAVDVALLTSILRAVDLGQRPMAANLIAAESQPRRRGMRANPVTHYDPPLLVLTTETGLSIALQGMPARDGDLEFKPDAPALVTCMDCNAPIAQGATQSDAETLASDSGARDCGLGMFVCRTCLAVAELRERDGALELAP